MSIPELTAHLLDADRLAHERADALEPLARPLPLLTDEQMAGMDDTAGLE